MKLIKVYDKNWLGKRIRTREEPKILEQGFVLEQEEDITERGGNCLTAVLFWPLLLVRVPKIKVTYSRD